MSPGGQNRVSLDKKQA